MYRLVIIDDEQPICDEIEYLLKQIDHNIENIVSYPLKNEAALGDIADGLLKIVHFANDQCGDC